jgi:hypothetical protein
VPRVGVSIGNRRLGSGINETQGYVIVDAHLLEDRTLVYAWRRVSLKTGKKEVKDRKSV